MSEENKKIIEKFVNSDDFYVIDCYISKPYVETINEMQEEKEMLKSTIDQLLKENRRNVEIIVKDNNKKMKYKSVLDEIRECAQQDCGMYEIIKILDKVKE